MKCRTEPCETCPYRRDVPSGVWSADEYRKLIEYDKPTHAQPPAVFYCHTSPDFVCTGWAQVHGARAKRGHELLALRFAEILRGEVLEDIPAPTTPLFSSGAAAARHGLREIERPSLKARRLVAKLKAARARKSARQKKKPAGEGGLRAKGDRI